MTYYTAKTVVAGKPGTGKWIKKYGDALLCVRYKYDLKRGRFNKCLDIGKYFSLYKEKSNFFLYLDIFS
jgi:hypothetical protein